jgi:threonine dehydratase
VLDLSDNEMAKVHLRHMVGGHAQCMLDEHIYRVMFPERPGALLHLLTEMGKKWNISLFHYRNHGAAFGRVLLGIQCEKPACEAFETMLDRLQYPYWAEDNNPAYHLFLNAVEDH